MLPQMIVLVLAFVYELTVHVFGVIGDGPKAELSRKIDRPHIEYVGDQRDVHVLYTLDRFHSLLTETAARRLSVNGIRVEVDDSKEFVLVAQPADPGFLFAPIGWLCMQQRLIPNNKLTDAEDKSEDVEIVTAAMLQQLRALFDKRHSTTQMNRSAPQDVRFDGVPAKSYKAIGFEDVEYYEWIEVSFEGKDGILVDILCGKPLTSSHNYGRIEHKDGRCSFGLLRRNGPVEIKQPLRRATEKYMQQVAKRPSLLERIRNHFKDKIEIYQNSASLPPTTPSRSKRTLPARATESNKKRCLDDAAVETADTLFEEQVLFSVYKYCSQYCVWVD